MASFKERITGDLGFKVVQPAPKAEKPRQDPPTPKANHKPKRRPIR